jgi:hypothetical protein
MLRKLLKHELKATSRLLIPLYLILVCITIINKILLRFDVSGMPALIDNLLVFLYVLSILSITIVTFILMIIRFYKNLMTDEGYLMFTLPVKSHDLINAKLLVTLFWTILSVIAIAGSLFIVFATPANMKMFMDSLHEVFIEDNIPFGISAKFLIILFILLCIIGTINSILTIYASIAIGQLFNGHKIIGSIAAYIGIYTAMQIIVTVAVAILSLNFNYASMEYSLVIEMFIVIAVIITALTVTFYYITNQLLKKKLNLD